MAQFNASREGLGGDNASIRANYLGFSAEKFLAEELVAPNGALCIPRVLRQRRWRVRLVDPVGGPLCR
jgi:hypothetical protein